MRTSESTSPRTHRQWWQYAAVVFLIVFLGVTVTVLASSGTLKRWFGSDQQAAATGDLWTCGMHPQVIQDRPGKCPICHMELTPLKAVAASTEADGMVSPAVTIDPVVVQNMGVRTAEVTRGPLRTVVRAVGYFVEAEPNIHDVNLRLSGWIEELHADTVGVHLNKGDPLFDLYSPQLQTAVDELITARRAAASASAGGGDELSARSSAAMYKAAERKLLLLGVQEEEVARLAKLERAPRTITYTSPVHGHVTEKPIVEGAAVTEGEKALRIVDHSTLWLDAQIYESQLPFISIGQKATATAVSMPGKTFEGEVIFIHPHVDPATRTVMVRLVIPNESLTLRPGMYGTVQITSELADQAILVPREAVIDTGTRQIAFLALAEGHFEPRAVKMGVTTQDGMVQILEGLEPGETVVTSGQFLLDSESRIKEAILKHLTQKQGQPDAAAPETAQSEPARKPPTSTPSDGNAEVDPLIEAYLDLSNLFGKPLEGDQPADVESLIAAARELVSALPPEQQPLAEKVAKAASAMQGHPMTHQRALFKPLSEAVIALVDQAPPSNAVAEKLFVMHCPMADEDRGADWLQTRKTVANPYFAKTMKRCGSVERTIELQERR